MNQFVGYRRIKNFCEVVGQRKKLNVFIDGAINDPEGIAEDVSNIGHWGTGNLRVAKYRDGDVAATDEHADYVAWFLDAGERFRKALKAIGPIEVS